jgi:hypothetical protein
LKGQNRYYQYQSWGRLTRQQITGVQPGRKFTRGSQVLQVMWIVFVRPEPEIKGGLKGGLANRVFANLLSNDEI